MIHKHEFHNVILTSLASLTRYDMDSIRIEQLRRRAHKSLRGRRSNRLIQMTKLYAQIIEPTLVFGFAGIFLFSVLDVLCVVLG